MYKTSHKDIWRVFRQHHYLSADLNKTADCFVAYYNNVLVGFCAVLVQPNGQIKFCRRISRVVILPDYQNLGFGTRLTEFIADYYLRKGIKIYIRTSHFRFYNYLKNSSKWIETSASQKIPDLEDVKNTMAKVRSGFTFGLKDGTLKRTAYSFEYLGNDYATKEKLVLCIDDVNIDYDSLYNTLKILKEKYYLTVITGEILTNSRIESICCDLGIYTKLLYFSKEGVISLSKKHVEGKVITTWNKELAQLILNDVNYLQNIDDKYCVPRQDSIRTVVKSCDLW